MTVTTQEIKIDLVIDAVKVREALKKINPSYSSLTGKDLISLDISEIKEQIDHEIKLLGFNHGAKPTKGYNLSGKECVILVGDRIRAWDFEPVAGREEAYVEGNFTGWSDDGRLIIKVDTDTLFSKGKRTEIFTPAFGQVIFGEWNGRITKL